jgi:RNA recognition motif-containing protein
MVVVRDGTPLFSHKTRFRVCMGCLGRKEFCCVFRVVFHRFCFSFFIQHSHTHTRPNAVEIQAKTLGVMNLADTVNEAQLRALFVPFGSLRRVVLRPDHAGAIVEYDDPADAGTASLALSGREIGHKVIQIGSYEDLMQQKSSQNDEKRAPTNLLLAPRQARTAQARRRVDVRHSATKQKKTEDVATQQAVDDQLRHEGGKKQDFFRALINKDSTTTEPVDND